MPLSRVPLLAALFCTSAAVAENVAAPVDPEAVLLEPVTVHPSHEDAFTASDRRLHELIEGSLPEFGEPIARRPGAIEGLIDWALVPSQPEPVSDAAALSAEEHLRNAGRSREQLP